MKSILAITSAATSARSLFDVAQLYLSVTSGYLRLKLSGTSKWWVHDEYFYLANIRPTASIRIDTSNTQSHTPLLLTRRLWYLPCQRRKGFPSKGFWEACDHGCCYCSLLVLAQNQVTVSLNGSMREASARSGFTGLCNICTHSWNDERSPS